MQKIKPAILFFALFGGIGFLSFKGLWEMKDLPPKIGKYYINVPDSLPGEYEGLYWASKQGDTLTIQPYLSREYQVELNIDSTEIWDGDRLVGKIPYDSASKFDLLMTKDNE